MQFQQGTLLMANIEYCHNDPRYWKYPNKFYPEHFIDENGKINTRKEGFLPFSIGKYILHSPNKKK